MRFSIYQDSAIGARTVNQDRMGYCFTRDCLFTIVADGMGGHLRGEVAAQLTLQATASEFQSAARPALEDPIAFLDGALRRAHRDILRYQQMHGLPESPRTTVVACVLQDGKAWWAHAGDSRLYLLRNGAVAARTRDHSKVQNLVALGLLQPSEQELHPERNKVLNCLGSPFEPTIEMGPVTALVPGDRFVLCSDGFWSGVSEAELGKALAAQPLAEAIPALIARAVAFHGRGADNATALAVQWDGESDRLPSADLSSLDVPEGAMTTTITLGEPEVEAAQDIGEDEIERAIREIRTAIERSGGR